MSERTTDPRPGMRNVIREIAGTLARQRHCPYPDALQACLLTYKRETRDSYGTSMEDYWRLMADLTSEMLMRSDLEGTAV